MALSCSIGRGSLIAGGERRIKASPEGLVAWTTQIEPPPPLECGLSAQSYTCMFSGLASGVVSVYTWDYLPWTSEEDRPPAIPSFYLLVDEELNVTQPKPFDFQSVRLTRAGMTAEQFCYEVERTDDGAVARSWTDHYNDDREGLSELELKPWDCAALAAAMGAADVASWNGFAGSAPDVLDGESFGLDIVGADETHVTAYGTNMWPRNYHVFHNALMHLFALEE